MNSPTTLFFVVVFEFLMTSTIMMERMMCLVKVAIELEERSWENDDDETKRGEDDEEPGDDDVVILLLCLLFVAVVVMVDIKEAFVPSS